MSHVIAIINQKGGVGKSTSALALGTCLNRRGCKTLLIDLDAQGNLSYAMGIDNTTVSSFDLFTDLRGHSAIQKTDAGDLIAASPILATADLAITQTGKEYRLQEALAPLVGIYDFIVLDTPPALGILTINALTAATGVIIPAQADIFSLQGIGQLHHSLDAVRKYTNPTLCILGILLTRYIARSVLSRDIAELLEETANQLETRVFTTRIRETVTVRESQARRMGLFAYAGASGAALDYENFTDEVLNLLRL